MCSIFPRRWLRSPCSVNAALRELQSPAAAQHPGVRGRAPAWPPHGAAPGPGGPQGLCEGAPSCPGPAVVAKLKNKTSFSSLSQAPLTLPTFLESLKKKSEAHVFSGWAIKGDAHGLLKNGAPVRVAGRCPPCQARPGGSAPEPRGSVRGSRCHPAAVLPPSRWHRAAARCRPPPCPPPGAMSQRRAWRRPGHPRVLTGHPVSLTCFRSHSS